MMKWGAASTSLQAQGRAHWRRAQSNLRPASRVRRPLAFVAPYANRAGATLVGQRAAKQAGRVAPKLYNNPAASVGELPLGSGSGSGPAPGAPARISARPRPVRHTFVPYLVARPALIPPPA